MATKIFQCPKCHTRFALNDHIRCPNCQHRVPAISSDLPKAFATCSTVGCALPLLGFFLIPTTYYQITGEYTRHPSYVATTGIGWLAFVLIIANLIRTFRRQKPPKSTKAGEP